ncbi:hypothetical protein RN001_014664 [Aquatica leii]|uniref:CRAL-TRIO domain-containing protein n=1 Tax=Aquatica leii TaxID=1421715 RepID=A0AAN7NUS5_9COLE|nr:hypothetical protein RN001_014664 [Aquatica leii]
MNEEATMQTFLHCLQSIRCVMADRTWLTNPDEYVCNLSEETQQLAKTELNEDKHCRDQALASMRHFIMQNPRIINCRMDSNFLLRFLRFTKFSVVQAQETLERYILLRQTYGIAFNTLDIRIPMMQDLVDLGFLFACPQRDKKGRRVYVVRPGVFDMNKFTNGDMLRIAAITFETLIEDEENQVRGFVYVADGRGVGLSYITLFSPKEAVRLTKNGEKTVPCRHAEIYGINVHPSMKFVADFGLSLLSEKIKSRVKIYSTLDDLLSSGNIEHTILPKEYGGITPMTDMIALWKEELHKSNKLLLSHDKMQVHEEMYTSKERDGAVSALKKGTVWCGGEEDPLYGITGNFRKLEVD